MKENSSLSLQKALSNVCAIIPVKLSLKHVYLMDINGDYEKMLPLQFLVTKERKITKNF